MKYCQSLGQCEEDEKVVVDSWTDRPEYDENGLPNE